MKNLIVLAMVAVALTIFNGCQKDEHVLIDEQISKNDYLFNGLKNIAFSIVDNRLGFENEEEFQKCINLLSQMGDENFELFEEEIGFISYRQKFVNTNDWDNNLKDLLLATLINPEKTIQVGDYLFQLDFTSSTVNVFAIEEGSCDLKSSLITKGKFESFSFYDDVFGLLSSGNITKSVLADYCTVNRTDESDLILQSGVNDGFSPFINIKVNAKISYQNYGIYRTFIVSTEPTLFQTSMNTRITLTMTSLDNVTWDLKNQDPHSTTVNKSETYGSTGSRLDERFFSTTNRVQSYHAYMRFSCKIDNGALPPYYNGQIFYATHFLECPY